MAGNHGPLARNSCDKTALRTRILIAFFASHPAQCARRRPVRQLDREPVVLRDPEAYKKESFSAPSSFQLDLSCVSRHLGPANTPLQIPPPDDCQNLTRRAEQHVLTAVGWSVKP
jgi:hypothetical protein